MKKIIPLSVLPVIISLAVLFGGCGVESVSPPTSSAATLTPATVQVTLSASSIAPLGTATVTATVTNASAQVVPNVSVSFSVISAASGSCTPTLAVTNASGQAVATFTAANVNANATIRATVTVGTSTIIGSAPIVIGTPPLVPTSIVVSLGSTTIASSGTTTVDATVMSGATPVSNATVTFRVSDVTAGNFSSSTAVTNASGVATVTFTANAVNTIVNITGTAGSLNNSASLTIGNPPPPTPASMSLTINPLSITISAQATVSVTLLTGTGSPAYNNGVTLTITSGASLASFSSSTLVSAVTVTTNASGTASAILYSGSSSGTVTVTATSGALTPRSASILITSDPASLTLTVVNPNLINGQTTNVTADVRNVLNNPVSNGTVVTFAITSICPCAGTFSATQASTVNGIAQVTFTADSSLTGGVIIQATAGTLSPVQTIIIVSAAQAATLEYVSVTPASGVINIFGAGTSSASVKFKVLSSTGSPLSGVSVNFTLYGPAGAYLDTGGTTSSGSTGSNGEVTTILHAGYVAGPVRIVATSGTLTASSGAISIGGGVPSDRFFSVAVSKFNLDGIGCNNLQSTITAYLADRFGNYNILQGTSVSFFTDSGAIDTSNVTDALGITSAVFRTQAPLPTDVAPLVTEPSYTFGGVTYNPRDGWLTILVSTTGEEYFVDENANGVYDSGETFIDLPEPFIDSNDNVARDTGELFFDWPTSVVSSVTGSYNNPNGVWDARIPIFRQVNLVMTGPPNFSPNTTRLVSAPTGTTGNISIPAGGSADFYVYVSDINMNAPIAGTKITATSSNTKGAITGGTATLADGLSFGPAILTFRVTNNNTTGIAETTTLSATVDWPGNCGRAAVYTIYYPGTVTLQ